MTAQTSLNDYDVARSLDEIGATPCQDNPDLFFPETNRALARAKLMCAGCPAQADCRAGARTRREGWGVWGGIFYYNGVAATRLPARGALSHRKYTDPSENSLGINGQTATGGLHAVR